MDYLLILTVHYGDNSLFHIDQVFVFILSLFVWNIFRMSMKQRKSGSSGQKKSSMPARSTAELNNAGHNILGNNSTRGNISRNTKMPPLLVNQASIITMPPLLQVNQASTSSAARVYNTVRPMFSE